MTKQEIIEKLKELEIHFDPKANKAELQKLLEVDEPVDDEPQVDEPQSEPEVDEPDTGEPEKPQDPQPEPKKKTETKIDYKNKLQRTKDALAKQPKVRIIIPKEKSETVGAFETVQINGYTYQIQKGVYVEVPQQVADIIMASRQETEEAIAEASKRVPDDERMEFDNSQS